MFNPLLHLPQMLITAEGDGAIYNDFKRAVMAGEHSLLTATIKVAILTGHTPNIDTHEDWADVSASESSGTGYTAGGETLGSKTLTKNTTDDRGEFDAANTTWTGLNLSGGEPSHAVMYEDTGTPATSQLIAYWEVTTVTNGGDYTLQYNAVGIITLT